MRKLCNYLVYVCNEFFSCSFKCMHFSNENWGCSWQSSTYHLRGQYSCRTHQISNLGAICILYIWTLLCSSSCFKRAERIFSGEVKNFFIINTHTWVTKSLQGGISSTYEGLEWSTHSLWSDKLLSLTWLIYVDFLMLSYMLEIQVVLRFWRRGTLIIQLVRTKDKRRKENNTISLTHSTEGKEGNSKRYFKVWPNKANTVICHCC